MAIYHHLFVLIAGESHGTVYPLPCPRTKPGGPGYSEIEPGVERDPRCLLRDLFSDPVFAQAKQHVGESEE